jgi:hypothetical protein
MYQRLNRFKEKQKILLFGHSDDNADDGAVGGVKGGGGGTAVDAPIKGGDLTPPPPPSAGSLSAAEVESGLKDLPPWIDPESCSKMLTRRKRKSLTEAHSYRLTEQVSDLHRAGRYKNAFKACTRLLKPAVAEDRSRGVTSMKGPVSVRKAVDRLNNEMLSSPNDRKLTKSAIQNAVARGSFGVSPLKNGRPRIVPPELTHGLACHAVMMQSSGEGEASSLKMRALAGALTMGTRHENKFSTDWLWRRTRNDHPRMIMPAKAINNEDRRVDWLTYKNIKDWNQKAKEYLISVGMGTPEQGLIRKSFVCLLLY